MKSKSNILNKTKILHPDYKRRIGEIEFAIEYYASEKLTGNLFLGSPHVITGTCYSQLYTVSDPYVKINLNSYLITDQPFNSITSDFRNDSGFFKNRSP